MTQKEVTVVFDADTSSLKKAMNDAKKFTQGIRNTLGAPGNSQAAKASQRVSKQTTQHVNQQAKAFTNLAKAAQQATKAVQGFNKANKAAGGGPGTPGKPPTPGKSPATPGGGGSRFTQATGFSSRDVQKLGRFVAGSLMTAIGTVIGIVTGQLTQGYQQRIQYGQTYGRLAGMGGKLSNLNSIRGKAARLGYTPIEMAQMAHPVARATGVVGGHTLTTAMRFQRMTGMDVGETAGIMGTFTQAGRGFGGKAGWKGKQDLIKTLALGFESGLDRARMPEFFSSVTQLVERQMAISPGEVDPTTTAALMQALGRSGLPGLQGARGGAVLASLDQAIKSPGGGEAGQAFMLQAQGYGKPGGTVSYYQALRNQQLGIQDPSNIRKMFAEASAQQGGPEASNLFLNKVTGVSLPMLEELQRIVKANMSEAEMTKEIARAQAKFGNFEDKALAEMQEYGDTTIRIAELQDRSIGIGSDIKDAIERMQDVINKGVNAMMPTVVRLLTLIASIMEDTYSFIQNTFGEDTELSRAQKENKQVLSEYQALRDTAMGGGIDRNTYMKKAAELRSRMKKAGLSTYASTPEAIWEGFAQTYTEHAAGAMGIPGVFANWATQGRGSEALSGAGGLAGILAPSSAGDANARARVSRDIDRALRDMNANTDPTINRYSTAELTAAYNNLSGLSSSSASSFIAARERENREYREGGADSLTLHPEFVEMMTALIAGGNQLEATFAEINARAANLGNPARTRERTNTGR